ncbi:hypothetical protein RND71_008048 [Anisodus tanguticus]|uniref:Uncharacterized protein n=1 Tax=Anisodus tanguticus TaxID=243964 RepID=A0AAE1SMY7_9SOLA|nr:hypothetical protein RND71_008048 [Anisodus tanguticus]
MCIELKISLLIFNLKALSLDALARALDPWGVCCQESMTGQLQSDHQLLTPFFLSRAKLSLLRKGLALGAVPPRRRSRESLPSGFESEVEVEPLFSVEVELVGSAARDIPSLRAKGSPLTNLISRRRRRSSLSCAINNKEYQGAVKRVLTPSFLSFGQVQLQRKEKVGPVPRVRCLAEGGSPKLNKAALLAKPRQEQGLKEKREEFNLCSILNGWLVGQDALVYRIDRSGQVRWTTRQYHRLETGLLAERGMTIGTELTFSPFQLYSQASGFHASP